MPQLSRIWGISICERRRSEEGLETKTVILGHARPDAITNDRGCNQKPTPCWECAMLKFDDIQLFLLTRPPSLAARYEFLTLRMPATGRAWLSGLVDKVGTGKSGGSASPDSRWVTLAFTWNGLRALGVDEASLNTFPEE